MATETVNIKDSSESMSYALPADVRWIQSVPLPATTSTSTNPTSRDARPSSSPSSAPSAPTPQPSAVAPSSSSSHSKPHLPHFLLRRKKSNSPERLPRTQQVSADARGGRASSLSDRFQRRQGSVNSSSASTRSSSCGPEVTFSEDGLAARTTSNLSGSSGCESATASDSGYSSSVNDEECREPFASTSNWVPCTPASPHPSSIAGDYFDSVHHSSNESTPSPISDASEFSSAPGLQRRHSAHEPPTPSIFQANSSDYFASPQLERSRTRSHSLSRLQGQLTPPEYQSASSRLTLRRERTICPREEEGHEGLPDYSCSIHLEGFMSRKVEQTEPGVKARDRSWAFSWIVIHGTTLKVYKYHPSTHPIVEPEAPNGSSSRSTSQDPSSRAVPPPPPGATANHLLPKFSKSLHPNVLLDSYSLQRAQCGLASDYEKDPFVVRVRAEGSQMLFKCKSLAACVDMIEALQAGINIALDLDARDIPVFVTLPRRRRRPAQGAEGATASASTSASEAVAAGRSDSS